MLYVGLTGNIGSGKSIVARIFSLLGVSVFNADAVAKALYRDPEVCRRLRGLFGDSIFTPAGEVERSALSVRIFSNPSDLKQLNGLIHPLVRDASREWASANSGHPYLIHEAAIIFESGFRQEYDRIIHVSCPPSLAIERVMKRDGMLRSEVEHRMQSQWPDEQKAALADYVILNDGSSLVIPCVLELDKTLRKLPS